MYQLKQTSQVAHVNLLTAQRHPVFSLRQVVVALWEERGGRGARVCVVVLGEECVCVWVGGAGVGGVGEEGGRERGKEEGGRREA